MFVFLVWSLWILYIFWRSNPCPRYHWQYVFPYCWFSFYFNAVSLDMQKLFNLMKSHLFILSFISLALGDISVNILLPGISEIFQDKLFMRQNIISSDCVSPFIPKTLRFLLLWFCTWISFHLHWKYDFFIFNRFIGRFLTCENYIQGWEKVDLELWVQETVCSCVIIY